MYKNTNVQTSAKVSSNKKLSYHRGTTRRIMLVNSCYVSRGMELKRHQTAKVTFTLTHVRQNWKWVMHPWPRPFKGWFVIGKLGLDIRCVQNLMTLAWAVPEISLGSQN